MQKNLPCLNYYFSSISLFESYIIGLQCLLIVNECLIIDSYYYK